MTTVDRQRGCLYGLAIGDALGAAIEFQPPGTFEPVTDYRAGGPHGLEPGEWTDDTSMALALADSIATAGWDLNDQCQRYVSWYRNGVYSVNDTCFDIGNTTVAALHRFERDGDATSSADTSPRASGNGSIMRLAPVPIRYLNEFDQLDLFAKRAVESSLTTHASPQCLSACRYMAILLAGLMQGLDREDVLSPDWEPLQHLRELEPLHPEVEAVAAGSFRERKPPEIRGRGYVVGSLEAALWAFYNAGDFREAVLRAVNLGDDSDTTGAVCGQFAGAYWGMAGIPQKWVDGLARYDMIDAALDGLLAEGTPDTAQPAAKATFVVPSSPSPVVRSYWVLEGQFLAGAYPGSSDPEKHFRRIEELWNSGIRTFINLIEENETNNHGQTFRRYDDDLRSIFQNANDRAAHLRFPVPDLSVPSTDRMRSIIDAIDLSLAAGRPVYLHCFGGVGRTGTAVCCWMIEREFSEPNRAIDLLRELRQTDKATAARKAPETKVQVNFVRSWGSDIANNELDPNRIPGERASWSEIQEFALSFSGYKYHGSFERCADIANSRQHATLVDLRTCLFFEQRRWRHVGERPEGEDMQYIRGILRTIRDKIAKGENI